MKVPSTTRMGTLRPPTSTRRPGAATSLEMIVAVAQHEHQIAAFDIAQISEARTKGLDIGRKARRLLARHPADAGNPLRALR